MSNVTFTVTMDGETGLTNVSAENLQEMQPAQFINSLAQSVSAFMDDYFESEGNYNYVAKAEFAGIFLSTNNVSPVEDQSVESPTAEDVLPPENKE